MKPRIYANSHESCVRAAARGPQEEEGVGFATQLTLQGSCWLQREDVDGVTGELCTGASVGSTSKIQKGPTARAPP